VISQLPPLVAGTPIPAILVQVGSRGRDIASYLFRLEWLFWPKVLTRHLMLEYGTTGRHDAPGRLGLYLSRARRVMKMPRNIA
jgi:hypothetical protein